MAGKSDEPTPRKGNAEVEVAMTDALLEVAARKPDEFRATVDALTPYVIEHDDGSITITAPEEVLKAVDQDAYATILDSLDKANQAMQSHALNADEALALRKIPWGQITAIAYEINGCGHGVVCMYTDSGYQAGKPAHRWYQYGCYNLSNELGDRYIFNHQFSGASVTLYTGHDCKSGESYHIPSGTTWQGNITPINSLRLKPP